jgi:hypothetical protein
LKEITGSSSEQTSATASAGAKGVGDEDGQKIADAAPDEKGEAIMESYSLPKGALAKFIAGGHLVPKQ